MEEEEEDKIYSVHELNVEIKNVISLNYSGKIKIEGEISNYKASSRNMFFTLKDDASKIDVVQWGNNGDSKLQNGKQVIVTGRITCWDKQGSYQITAYKVEVNGIGDLYTLFLKLQEKYNKAGYFDPTIKKPLKDDIKNIGVITALEGAALKDFLYVLEKNKFHGGVYVKGCLVQGKDCPKSVAKCVGELDELGLDVIVITRGGGSYEDLFGFSHKDVIDSIFNAKTCIISAIGHEVDTMLSDHVADIRAPTPSVAGEILALHQRDRMSVDHIFNDLERLHMEIVGELQEYRMSIQDIDNLVESPMNIINGYYGEIDNFKYGLRHELNSILGDYLMELKQINFTIDSNNPHDILKNGYVMLIDPDSNKLIKSSSRSDSYFGG